MTLCTLIGASGLHAQVAVTATPQSGNTPLSVELSANTPWEGEAGSYLENGGLLVLEAESFTSSNPNGDPNGVEWVTANSIGDYSGSGYIKTPGPQGQNASWSNGCEVAYLVDFSTTGTYHVWVRRRARTGASNSAFLGIDGANVGGVIDNQTANKRWRWKHGGLLEVVDGGPRLVQLRRREAKYCVDRLILTTNPDLDPSGLGPPANNPEVELTFVWDFGDGTLGEGANVNHVYAAAGTFTATVTVSDGVNVQQGSIDIVASVETGEEDEPVEATLENIVISPTNPTISVGGSTTFSAQGMYSDGALSDLPGASFASSDDGVLVMAGSVGSAISAGSAQVTASFDNVSSAPATVTVLAPSVESLVASSADSSIDAGTSTNLNALATYADGTVGDVTASVVWQASDPLILVMVPGAASVVGVSAGNASVSCVLDGVSSNPVPIEVSATDAATALAMNAAGEEVQVGGTTYLGDSDFDGTNPGFEGGNPYSQIVAIDGTEDDELYQSIRYGDFGFRAPLAPGTYQVQLHYSEIYAPFGAGDRVFNVIIEGEVVQSDLDVFAEVGYATALVHTHFVELQDSVLEIDWQASVNFGVISAVKITPIDSIPEQEMIGLTINPGSMDAWEGSQPSFSAFAQFNFGPTENVTADASWGSSNPAVLAVAGSPGLFNALALGEADVFVSYGGFSGVAAVTVVEAPEVGNAVVFTRGSHLHTFDVIAREASYIEAAVHSDIMILEPIAPNGTVTNLTNLPQGNGAAAFYPSVTHDGLYILFSMRMAWNDQYQIYRMRIDGSELTQITSCPAGQPHDNMNPVQLGGGRIAFISNRNFMKDEYGKRDQFNIFTADMDGSNETMHLDGLSGSYDLEVFSDGRLVFSRWDYRPLHNRVAIDNFALWTMNSDGTGLDVFWGLHFLSPRNGNHGIQDWRRPQEFPDGRLLTIGNGRLYSAQNYSAGFLAVVDPVTTMLDGFTNITPQIPEGVAASPDGRYLDAVPWGNDAIIGSFASGPVITSQGPAPNFNLVTLNANGTGRTTLVSDPNYHLAQPCVVQTRSVPFVSTSTDPTADHGVVACDNVFIQNHTQEIGSLNRVPFDVNDPQRNPVKVRLLEGFVLKKTQAYGGVPKDTTLMSDIKSTLGYKILGEVPIMSDGSFAAKVPPNKPIMFQVVNPLGQVIQSMPIWTMAGAGEEKRCVGCHDHHDGSVPLESTNQALDGEIADLTEGTIMDFQDDLTSILAQKCGGCHSGPNPPFNIDLSGDRTLFRDMAYRSLAQLPHGRFGMPDWAGFSYLADWRGLGGIDSFLLSLLSGTLPHAVSSQQQARLEELFPTHAGLLEVSELKQFGRWAGMATLKGNPFYRFVPEGEVDDHDYPQPDMDMWENDVAPMLISRCSGCHDYYPTWLQLPGFTTNTQHWEQSVNVNHQSFSALLSRTGINSNFDHPEWSPILDVTLGNHGHPTVFSSPSDPDWELLLEWIQSGAE